MTIHDQFDIFTCKWITRYRTEGGAIHCRAGCAGCCSLAVHATWPEAVKAAAELSATLAANLDSYVARLRLALPGLHDMHGYLRLHRRELGPCPFLDAQGSCSLYAVRPLSCRSLLSTRAAEWCSVDFAELDNWDRQAYESGLDMRVVAWPTHYVAATQDFGRALEGTLLEVMHRECGWTLAGNFPLMVWLEAHLRLSEMGLRTVGEVRDLFAAEGLANDLVLYVSATPPNGKEPSDGHR